MKPIDRVLECNSVVRYGEVCKGKDGINYVFTQLAPGVVYYSEYDEDGNNTNIWASISTRNNGEWEYVGDNLDDLDDPIIDRDIDKNTNNSPVTSSINYAYIFDNAGLEAETDGSYLITIKFPHLNYEGKFTCNETLSYKKLVLTNRNGVVFFQANSENDCNTPTGMKYDALSAWKKMEKGISLARDAMMNDHPEWNSIWEYPRLKNFVDEVEGKRQIERESFYAEEQKNLDFLKSFANDIHKLRKIGARISVVSLVMQIVGWVAILAYMFIGLIGTVGISESCGNIFNGINSFIGSMLNNQVLGVIFITIMIAFIPVVLILADIGYRCNSYRDIKEEKGWFKSFSKEDSFSTKLFIADYNIIMGILFCICVASIVGIIFFVVCLRIGFAVAPKKEVIVERRYYDRYL